MGLYATLAYNFRVVQSTYDMYHTSGAIGLLVNLLCDID
jgi:hypothetical protein